MKHFVLLSVRQNITVSKLRHNLNFLVNRPFKNCSGQRTTSNKKSSKVSGLLQSVAECFMFAYPYIYIDSARCRMSCKQQLQHMMVRSHLPPSHDALSNARQQQSPLLLLEANGLAVDHQRMKGKIHLQTEEMCRHETSKHLRVLHHRKSISS